MSHNLQSGPTPAIGAGPLLFDPGNEYRAPLERLIATVVAMASARGGALRILDSTGERLQLVCATALNERMRDQLTTVDASCGVCGDSMRSNARACATVNCACARQFLPADSTPNVTVVPLRYRDSACGVLSLFHADAHAAQSDLCGLIPALGDVLGLALESSRHTEERLLSGVIHERHVLANEVHDTLAQNLSSMRMRASLLRDAVRDGDTRRMHGHIGEIDETLRVAQSRVRELITHFRTEMDPRGLLPALETTIAELGGLGNVRISMSNRITALDLAPEQELQTFHIVREALTNAVKHSGANEIRLSLAEFRDQYEFEIEDNGVGFDPEQCGEHGHFGLNIMRERAARIGGHIVFEQIPVHGTRVRLTFRIASAEHRGQA